MKKTNLIFCALCLALSAFAQTNPSKIALIKKTIIGGEGGWDYLSVSAEDRHLYLSHGNQVEVLNVDTHEKIGVIADLKGVHGICAIPTLGKGYITNGATDNVAVFDTKTLKIIKLVPTGKKPDALLYDAFSNRVFIFNNAGKTATVINPSDDSVVKTIELGGEPEAGVSNGKGTIFVNLEDTNEIVVFDSKSLKVKNRFSLKPGEAPTGLAMDRATNRLFSACNESQTMMVLNAKTGKIVAKLPIGKGADGAIFDPKNNFAISSNGEGSFTIVREKGKDAFDVFDTITTQKGARTITIDTQTGHIFTISAEYGERPEPTKENPRPRANIVPNTFTLLEFAIN